MIYNNSGIIYNLQQYIKGNHDFFSSGFFTIPIVLFTNLSLKMLHCCVIEKYNNFYYICYIFIGNDKHSVFFEGMINIVFFLKEW